MEIVSDEKYSCLGARQYLSLSSSAPCNVQPEMQVGEVCEVISAVCAVM